MEGILNWLKGLICEECPEPPDGEPIDAVLAKLHEIADGAVIDWLAYGFLTLIVANDRSFDRYPPVTEYANWKRAHYDALKDIIGKHFV